MTRESVNLDVPRAMAASILQTETTLDALSSRHYKQNLKALLAHVETPKGRRQYARLLGVMLKEPFAEEVARAPSESTGAVIGLRWKENDELRKIAPNTWQFGFALLILQIGVDGFCRWTRAVIEEAQSAERADG